MQNNGAIVKANEYSRADELLNEIEAGDRAAAEASMQTVRSNPYVGIATEAFSAEAAEILLGPVAESDVEIRPDGLIYLPEIKYRRTLNRAFGPGAWSLLPMEIVVETGENMLYYKGALFVLGRFVSEAIGEQQYFPDNDRMSYATAAESAKSNCLMRCCKDLGIASELWDPTYVRNWIARYARQVWCVNIGSRDRGKKKAMWRKNDSPMIDMYPWKEEVDNDWQPQREQAPSTPQGMAGATYPPKKDDKIARVTEEIAHIEKAYKPKAAVREPLPGDNCPLPLAPLASVKQIGRFRAIARSNGWVDAEVRWLLKKFGFARAEEITRDAYDRICTALENPVILTEVRAEIDEDLDRELGIDQTQGE